MNARDRRRDLYLAVRSKEGRMYPDAIVRQLPRVPDDHPLRHEWDIRTRSADRLADSLSRLRPPIRALDLGCGNGWLAHRLSRIPGVSVVGADHNRKELDQARRVFADTTQLSWIEADIFRAPFRDRCFDVVLIASAIQYFPDVPSLIRALCPLLTPDGEIHILDSPLYPPDQLPDARRRSLEYYRDLGFPEMARHYHHHAWTVLDRFQPHWLYRPRSRNRGEPGNSPFPWIRLRPERPCK